MLVDPARVRALSERVHATAEAVRALSPLGDNAEPAASMKGSNLAARATDAVAAMDKVIALHAKKYDDFSTNTTKAADGYVAEDTGISSTLESMGPR